MIPKKVRKILSIMIAVALVMAVIPAVAFADEVNTLFGNGDETVASTGDATEAEEAAPVENGTEEDEGVAQTPVDDENADASQPVDVALTDNDTDIELANICGNAVGNLNSLSGMRGLNETVSTDDFAIIIDFSNKDTTHYDNPGGVYANYPAYYNHVSKTKNPTYSVTYKGSATLPTGYEVESHDYDYGDGCHLFAIDLLYEGSSVKEEYKYYYRVAGPSQAIYFHKNILGDDGTTQQNATWGTYFNMYLQPNYIDSTSSASPKCRTFLGWYLTSDCTGEAFDLKNTVIEKKYDLYAKWNVNHGSSTIEEHDSVEPTCTDSGNIKYWECSNCGSKYTDSALTSQVLDVSVPAKGHSWGTPQYDWNNNDSVTAHRICANDATHDDPETETVDTTFSVTKKATCSKGEEITYTAEFTNALFETQTKTVVGAVDPDAHDWGEVTYKWSNDNSSVTAIRTCKNDISHNETETVSTTKTVTKEATETAPGDILYSAEFSNPAFEKQTKYEEIPAKGSSEKQPEEKKSEEPTEEKKSEEPTADEEAFYINASGAKITWTAGSTDTLNIKFERSEDNASTSKHFLGIEVDGKATSKDLYDTEDGSIIIKLKPALLENLGEGEHTLTALFDDGSASAKFTIIKATKEVKNEKKTTSKNAKTGDSSPIKFVIILMIISALAIAGTLIIKKKRH